MEIIGIAINKIIVELVFLFVLSTPQVSPMEFEMYNDDGDYYFVRVESEGENYEITFSSKEYYDLEVYAEWYDVFAYMVYSDWEDPYLIDLGYFFEIELGEHGFPDQVFNHNQGGKIHVCTGENYTVIEYLEEGITLKMNNIYYSME